MKRSQNYFSNCIDFKMISMRMPFLSCAKKITIDVSRSILIVILATMVASCSLRKEVNLGRDAIQAKNWDEAVEHFLKAVKEKPDNAEYRISLSNALISASNVHMKSGIEFLEMQQYKPALMELNKSLEYNPENNNSRIKKRQLLEEMKKLEKAGREKTEIEQLKEDAGKEKLSSLEIDFAKKPYCLKMNGIELKQLLKALQKSSGITFIYDESFKSKRLDVDMDNIGFIEALDLIMLQTNCFYKVIDPHTVMIIPDNPNKRKDYEELVIKSFFLSYVDPEEIHKLVTSLTGVKTTVINKESGILIVKGTPDEVNLAQRIIQTQDKPKGELFIDIEVIEVNRSRTNDYGIELSQYQVSESYSPLNTKEAGSIRLNMLSHTDMSDYLLTLPTINYKLLKSDSDSKIKARPQLRVVDQQPVDVKLGDKVPIPSTSFVPYNTGGPQQQPITSYTQSDIGINISLTPHIHHDGLVTMKMKFELTFVTNPGTERIPPTIGNRSITTVIKLRDSETSILAGLLRDTERKSMRGLPFLSSLPVLKQIFSGNTRSIEQTDIILTITPRIIRYPEITQSDLSGIWAGTQSRPGLRMPPSTLKIQDDDSQAKPNNPKNTNASPDSKDKMKMPDTTNPNPVGTPLKNDNVNPIESTSSTLSEKKEIDKNTSEKDPSREIKVEKKETVEPLKNEIKELPVSNANVETPLEKSEKSGLKIMLGAPNIKTKKNTETDVPINICGTGATGSISFEFTYDPLLINVLDIRRGELLEKKRMKIHLLKSYDNKEGIIKITISIEEPITINDTSQLVIIRFTAPKTGDVRFEKGTMRILDAEMKETEVSFEGFPISVID